MQELDARSRGHQRRMDGREQAMTDVPPQRLNSPMIAAFASVLKCRLKPTTAAEVSAFTSSVSATANTVNR